MRTEVITINTNKAKELMIRNVSNRPLNSGHVRMLSNEMTSGRFALNGEPIIIGNDGYLLDGQHRLQAVIESGVSIQCLVVYDVDPETFDTINNVRPRRGEDALACAGVKNYASVASLLLFMHKYERNTLHLRGRFTQTMCMDMLKKYPDAPEIVSRNLKYAKKLLPSGVMYGIAYVNKHKHDEVSRFFDVATTGICQDSTTASAKLAERMIKNKVSKSKLSTANATAICIVAWNYHVENIKPTFIRYSETQQYPKIKIV